MACVRFTGSVSVIRPNLMTMGRTIGEIWQFVFKMSTVRSNWDSICARLDHPRRVFYGLYRRAKIGCNQCSISDNIQILIFYELFTPINAPRCFIKHFGGANRIGLRTWVSVSTSDGNSTQTELNVGAQTYIFLRKTDMNIIFMCQPLDSEIVRTISTVQKRDGKNGRRKTLNLLPSPAAREGPDLPSSAW